MDFLKDALSAFIRALMDAEVNALAGDARGERLSERVSERNGYRERRWDASAGTLELAHSQAAHILRTSHFTAPSHACRKMRGGIIGTMEPSCHDDEVGADAWKDAAPQ